MKNSMITIAALSMLAMPATAGTKKAQCFLQVDGVVHIDGICDMAPISKGAFDISKGNGWFAFVAPKDDGTADGYWNRDYGKTSFFDAESWEKATLTRKSACWVNGNTKVCAWRIGENRGDF